MKRIDQEARAINENAESAYLEAHEKQNIEAQEKQKLEEQDQENNKT